MYSLLRGMSYIKFTSSFWLDIFLVFIIKPQAPISRRSYVGYHTWDVADISLKRADTFLAPNHSGGEWRYWNMKQNHFILKSLFLFLLVGWLVVVVFC